MRLAIEIDFPDEWGAQAAEEFAIAAKADLESTLRRVTRMVLEFEHGTSSISNPTGLLEISR